MNGGVIAIPMESVITADPNFHNHTNPDLFLLDSPYVEPSYELRGFCSSHLPTPNWENIACVPFGGVRANLLEELGDNLLEMGMGFALEAALRDAAQGARPGLKQSQIALCSSDVAGQDHRLPRGFYPFGSFDFPPGGDARNGFERASRANRLAAASSTRKMRRPSGTVTSCAGSGGSVLPSSTA